LLTVLQALAEFFLVIAVALTAVLLRTLDARGFLASAAVGFAIIFGGGFSWFVVVAVFFVLGVAFTLYKYGYKKRIGGAQEKGGARNWPNILANGGLASIFAVLNLFGGSPYLGALFLGAISTATSDTAATELGLLSKGKPRLITNPSRTVLPGTSGGVSTLGFVGAAFGAGVIGVMALLLGILPSSPAVVLLCIASGLVGSLADSLIGAGVQRHGYCPVCLKPTELLSHCGERTVATKGARYIENNVVNLLATGAGALASFGIVLLFSR
jgi:uncharacterized protein (TIGR00297 family)